MKSDVATDSLPYIELDTYNVLDGRRELRGVLRVPSHGADAPRAFIIRFARRGGGAETETRVPLAPGEPAADVSFAVPLVHLTPGYYSLTLAIECASGERRVCEAVRAPGGARRDVTIALRGGAPASARGTDIRGFVKGTVERLLEQSSQRLGGKPGGALFATRADAAWLGYRSIGARVKGKVESYWFPEAPFDFETCRADLEMWPVLDCLAEQTGEPRYRDLVDAMAAAFGRVGFDPRCGLGYLGTEADLDVARATPLPRLGCDILRFKPSDIGTWPPRLMDRLWRAAPEPMARMAHAAYYALVTDPATMDFDRHIGTYDFDDCERRHQMQPSTAACGFSSAGTSLLRLWTSCFARTGDAECLHWAARMAEKWRAVQHPVSGLLPYCFGASPDKPLPMPPVDFSEPMDSAWSALALSHAADDTARRPEGHALSATLADMSLRLARGVVRHGFDAPRGVFHHFTHLDGSRYEASLRYTFCSAAEKAAAVREDPQMAQVPVFDGSGWYEPGPYWTQCAGANMPYHVAAVAARTGDPELIGGLREWARRIVEAAGALTSALTAEHRWTFHATGIHIQTLVLLAQATGDESFIGQAEALAHGELQRLARVAYPHWWRLPERTAFLDALLALDGHGAGRARKAGP